MHPATYPHNMRTLGSYTQVHGAGPALGCAASCERSRNRPHVSRAHCISQASPGSSLSRYHRQLASFPSSSYSMIVPSVGDILMLSQKAWKIGRAFASCDKDAPSELQSVERDIDGLAKALRLLAETLHAESEEDLLHNADQAVQHGIGVILYSCQRTVDDLDSLVDQYQVIKKHRTVGGFAIERSWSDLVLSEYRTMIWTTEEGNLHELRDLLRTHTNSTTVLMQALQRPSLIRLENVVKPMVERIDGMHHASGTLDREMDEVLRMAQDLTVTPQDPQTPPVPARNPARSPTTEVPNPLSARILPSSPSLPPNTRVSLPRFPQPPITPEEPTSADLDADSPPEPSPTETISISRMSDPAQRRISRISDFSFGTSSIRYSSSSYASSEAGASSAGWQSVPQFSNDYFHNRNRSTSTTKTTPLPRSLKERESGIFADNQYSTLHPLPATSLAPSYELQRSSTNTSQAKLSPFPSPQPEVMKLHRSATTTSQKAAFEKDAFRNSAVLCDVRGKLVEYSHRINQDDPHDVEMLQISGECRIAVVRKRITHPESRVVRVVTSIWAFSDDNNTRVELRMEDDQMYIPYSSYFSPSKVSITVPCELKFHDIVHGNRPLRVAKTSWVNYVFASPQAAALFQNELMGRTLLATFRTEKTMRLHTSLVGKSFSYAEQMCGLENLRVWEDNDSGAIIALMHFSAHFRGGYLAFYLNDALHPVKVKDDGGREVKIKGLRVPIEGGAGGSSRKDSAVEDKGKGKGKVGGERERERDKEKGVIGGAKVEFASEGEKREFLDLCKHVQGNMIELPDLLGVN
ncbi:hypothetical protein GMOD_00008988 [Pyrenophora seminiperda CCB06]|uniref:Uncharacterized protein n=1 Tax=Pyrenophora seminiperda CCB06 TaxID=1302712 RepID=A0A3M7MFG2_9PLEO|nr:hypothetical protein GMOD_00008988 [Pyrenophora seminiperda CCB06]